MTKELGKIEKVRFGHCGYQDSCLGISFVLTGKGWGLGDSKSTWDAELIKHTENSQWSEEDRNKQYSEIMRYVSKLLKDAKVSNISELQGKPIEVTLDGNLLKEWRILSEVL
jgi:hypothetical protein